ncbi:hypothetical protein PM082_012436 [Marasmius tenuissimus]|nr:hypothetical protein PM082_012436 [Marasmius tenuissimus]
MRHCREERTSGWAGGSNSGTGLGGLCERRRAWWRCQLLQLRLSISGKQFVSVVARPRACRTTVSSVNGDLPVLGCFWVPRCHSCMASGLENAVLCQLVWGTSSDVESKFLPDSITSFKPIGSASPGE